MRMKCFCSLCGVHVLRSVIVWWPIKLLLNLEYVRYKQPYRRCWTPSTWTRDEMKAPCNMYLVPQHLRNGLKQKILSGTLTKNTSFRPFPTVQLWLGEVVTRIGRCYLLPGRTYCVDAGPNELQRHVYRWFAVLWFHLSVHANVSRGRKWRTVIVNDGKEYQKYWVSLHIAGKNSIMWSYTLHEGDLSCLFSYL